MKKKRIELAHPLTDADIAALRSYSLGFRIQKLRLCADMKQSEFASLFGVSQTAVVAWENDEHIPRSRVLNDMQMIFGLPMDFFLDAEIERVKLRKKRPQREAYMSKIEQIEYGLLKGIIDRVYLPGAEMLSSYTLAAKYNTSHTTVSNAFVNLLDSGILKVRRGKTYIISDDAMELAEKQIEKFRNKAIPDDVEGNE